MKRLKPCRCGEITNLMVSEWWVKNGIDGYFIECGNCMIVQSKISDTEQEAIDSWNELYQPETEESTYKKMWNKLKTRFRDTMEYPEPLLDCMDEIEKELKE